MQKAREISGRASQPPVSSSEQDRAGHHPLSVVNTQIELEMLCVFNRNHPKSQNCALAEHRTNGTVKHMFIDFHRLNKMATTALHKSCQNLLFFRSEMDGTNDLAGKWLVDMVGPQRRLTLSNYVATRRYVGAYSDESKAAMEHSGWTQQTWKRGVKPPT